MSNAGILILSAPSGGGKTSLSKALVERTENVEIAVSHTTRAKRETEQDGVHYFFVCKKEFKAMIAAGEFIEYATVFNNYYGTSIKAIDFLLHQGKHAILDIDWQGARRVKARFSNARSVFVMPPAVRTLRQRLEQRNQDSPEVIRQRMNEAMEQISHKDEFDQVIVNDDFDKALQQLKQILGQLLPVN